MLPPGSSSSSDDVSSNALISLLSRVLPHFFFSYIQLFYKMTSHNFFKHIVCYGHAPVLRNSAISDGILLYGYVSVSGHIIPEAEKANMAVMDALVRPLSTSYTFLTLLHAKTFPVFGKNWELDISPLKVLAES